MKGRLHEPHSGGMAFSGAIHHGAHELASDAEVLRAGVDRDGSDASDRGTLVEAIAADDAAPGFGDDAVEAGAGEHGGKDGDADLGRG